MQHENQRIESVSRFFCESAKLLGLLVDLIGIEPMTSSMPWKRAPSCATGPHSDSNATLLLSPLGRDSSNLRFSWRWSSMDPQLGLGFMGGEILRAEECVGRG